MYIDISSHNGAINWRDVAAAGQEIDGAILRATTKNNKLDVRTMENYNGILQNISGQIDELSFYKFSYARDYVTARVEAMKCLKELADHGLHFDRLYLDLELWDGRDYTKDEANAVILAYCDVMDKQYEFDHFGIYTNYDYLKRVIDPMWYKLPIWLARWSNGMGDTMGANIVLWQYSNKGKIAGIGTDVDLSREVKYEAIR